MNDTLKTVALCLIAAALVIQTIMQISTDDTSNDISDNIHAHDHAPTASNNVIQQNTQPPNPQKEISSNEIQPKQNTGPTTTVKFEEYAHDFGMLNEGDKVYHKFKFKNTGTTPLIIENARGSCGCTVPQWPREPIAPGESGEIEVSYDSKNRKGKQTKSVSITANTEPRITKLNIIAIVATELQLGENVIEGGGGN